MEKLLTSEQAAQLLQASTHTVRKWARTGKLPCVRPCRRFLRFRPSDIETWLEQNTVTAQA